MIYPVYIIGHEVLRKEGRDIDVETEKESISTLIQDMFETMQASEGIGLAAPQIGKSMKLFVIDASPLADDIPELADFKHAFINAKIIEKSGDLIKMNEGCLSIPGLHEDVWRYDKIKMRYVDENFEQQEKIFEGYPARIIQHEYDHTYGILFTDRVAKIKRALLQNKLKSLALGKFNAKYRTVLGDKKSIGRFIMRNIEN